MLNMKTKHLNYLTFVNNKVNCIISKASEETLPVVQTANSQQCTFKQTALKFQFMSMYDKNYCNIVK